MAVNCCSRESQYCCKQVLQVWFEFGYVVRSRMGDNTTTVELGGWQDVVAYFPDAVMPDGQGLHHLLFAGRI